MGSTPNIPETVLDNKLRKRSISMTLNDPIIATDATTTTSDDIATDDIDMISATVKNDITDSSSSSDYSCGPNQQTICDGGDGGGDNEDNSHIHQQESIDSTINADTQSMISIASSATTTTGPKLKMSCEMCNNYEIQLQEMQYNEVVISLQLEAHEKTIRGLRDELKKEQHFRSELEEKFNEDLKNNDKEIRELCLRLDESQRNVDLLSKSHSELRKEANDIIVNLMGQMEETTREMERLQKDNEHLLAKHVAKSQVLQNETIDLPQDISEMQFQWLKIREELITTLVAKERNDETLKSEILFLKEQMAGEQEAKDRFEEELSHENDMLRSTKESLEIQLHELRQRCDQSDRELRDSQLYKESTQQKLQELTAQINDLNATKTKFESDNGDLRNRVQSLQQELDNSEAVQKDFVKLSQSLQIQLEKIRQSDNEVRWQHEDDVGECNTCKKQFHSKKEKSHCCHCGRVFCTDCNSKVIYSGPKSRPFKVCGVCHTLLDKQTACWFVNEAPQSPT
ncbi:rab GTPase-binding effector protein 1-like [Oppia nitens]|uniref:rab GTPase-binding effector protein 1-like n=1 Tax=Oppia nitens TaxID=1686743 RepID=UPI0023DBE877|nr:rab GTPase-binding effector protein 1-like [Oppia nitens]